MFKILVDRVRIDNVPAGQLRSLFAIIAVATTIVAILVFYLSLQLRRGERFTLARIGASRLQVHTLMATEVIFVLVVSAILSAILLALAQRYGIALLQQLLLA